MRFTFFIIIFLFISCTSNINKIDNEELKLDEKLASDLIQLSINCVDKKFPYKVGYRYVDSTWIKPHYKHTPSFYGCWDWHSAVHGHWSMVKILKEFPNIKEAENIRTKIRKGRRPIKERTFTNRYR